MVTPIRVNVRFQQHVQSLVWIWMWLGSISVPNNTKNAHKTQIISINITQHINRNQYLIRWWWTGTWLLTYGRGSPHHQLPFRLNFLCQMSIALGFALGEFFLFRFRTQEFTPNSQKWQKSLGKMVGRRMIKTGSNHHIFTMLVDECIFYDLRMNEEIKVCVKSWKYIVVWSLESLGPFAVIFITKWGSKRPIQSP
jgi:hypothetical protein